MADIELIKPRELPEQANVQATDALMVDNGTVVGKATPEKIVNAGAPVASEAEALAGVNNNKRMTPLRVRQVLDNVNNPAVLRAQAWAESTTPPDPLLPDSKSAKTWASIAEQGTVMVQWSMIAAEGQTVLGNDITTGEPIRAFGGVAQISVNGFGPITPEEYSVDSDGVVTLTAPLAEGDVVSGFTQPRLSNSEAQAVVQGVLQQTGVDVAAAQEAADRAEVWGARTMNSSAQLATDSSLTEENTPVGSTVDVRYVGIFARVSNDALYDIVNSNGLRFSQISSRLPQTLYSNTYANIASLPLFNGVSIIVSSDETRGGIRDRYVYDNYTLTFIESLMFGADYLTDVISGSEGNERYRLKSSISWLMGDVDVDAVKYMSAMIAPPSSIYEASIIQFFDDIKSSGLWGKIAGLWLLANETDQGSLINAVNPSSSAIPLNSPTFVSGSGWRGDGATSYLNTRIRFQNMGAYGVSTSSASIGVWSMSPETTNAADIGITWTNLYCANGGNNAYGRMNSTDTFVGGTTSGRTGLFSLSRTGATVSLYYGGSLVSGGSRSIDNFRDEDISILRAASSYSTRAIGAAYVGAGLSISEVSALNDAIGSYMNSVGA